MNVISIFKEKAESILMHLQLESAIFLNNATKIFPFDFPSKKKKNPDILSFGRKAENLKVVKLVHLSCFCN